MNESAAECNDREAGRISPVHIRSRAAGETHLVRSPPQGSLPAKDAWSGFARHRVKEFRHRSRAARHMFHTGASADGWSPVDKRGTRETLTASALPRFLIRDGDIQ
jgi:hypothetical protein